MIRKKKSGKVLSQKSKIGSIPGTPIFIGEQKIQNVIIDVLEYTSDKLKEHKNISPETLSGLKNSSSIKWISIKGIHDINVMENIGNLFSIHPLTVEDLVNTTHRPKVELFQDYLFFVVKVIKYDDATNALLMEHVSLILGENYVITFSEENDIVFNPVRERILMSKGRIRNMKSDYLAYALIDCVVDYYYYTMEKTGDYIDQLEEIILTAPESKDIEEIHRLKRDMLKLRKEIWPLREEVGILQKNATKLVDDETRIFLYDLYEHVIQILDMVETYRELLFGMHDTYLSSLNNKMNETMKLLTIIGTIFIPLTFIVGLYGMNFENMPELKWQWGYYLVWAVMITISIVMFRFFKRKKWF